MMTPIPQCGRANGNNCQINLLGQIVYPFHCPACGLDGWMGRDAVIYPNRAEALKSETPDGIRERLKQLFGDDWHDR